MTNKPFLQQVAQYYVNSGIDLSRYTFVLPNKRSAMFLRMYLKSEFRKIGFMPRIVSITYFTQQFCNRQIASNTELLFILYNAYCRVLRLNGRGDQVRDFDSFIFWGNILLNDFNDVDAYMADPHELFKNIYDFNEIESNFLTPEQVEVAQNLWGIDMHYDFNNFWKHVPTEPQPDGISAKFLSLWELMSQIYDEFNKALVTRPVPIIYSGLQSKLACETVRDMSLEDFGDKRYAFVGFNALSTSRALIFKRLKDLGIADFFWDTASPYISDPEFKNSKAGRFVMPLSKKFPSPDDFELEPISTFADIEIVAVPSNVGQTKVATATLDAWRQDGFFDNARLVETGVVLPDANLLTPMLYSIPEYLKPINITMGVPYLSTPFATLLDAIMRMQHRAKLMPEPHYLAIDVDEVISNPQINLIAHKEVLAIKKEISAKHFYFISTSELQKIAPSLDFIFKSLKDENDFEQARSYLSDLIEGLKKRIIEAGIAEGSYQLLLLKAYSITVDEIASLAVANNIQMQEGTFFTLMRKTLASLKILFNGDPVKGLQIMDVMDARLLDFDNLIVLSMNERIFPRKNPNPSLIPASLRHAYELPTQEHEESTSAYQFYRLISRASHISLVYDSRAGGLKSGEMSRYLSQLLYLPSNAKVTVRDVKLSPDSQEPRAITINKTADVLAELQQFCAGGKFNFSASMLKAYIKCPLSFYLQFIKRLKLEDENIPYIDNATYGTVLHGVAQDLYQNYECSIISPEIIDRMLKEDIVSLALKRINKEYYKNRYQNIQHIPGEGQVLAKIIAKYIKLMLNFEKEGKPFVFLKAEDQGGQHQHHWKISDDYTINFTMSIDRVDKLDDAGRSLRFIDYKTGTDEIKANSVADLFVNKKLGGFFQVLTYCLAYSEIMQYDGAIKPMIYKFTTMATQGLKPFHIGGDIEDFAQVRDEFSALFRELIDKILEPHNKYPFVQTDNLQNCEYCPFTVMCRRQPKK